MIVDDKNVLFELEEADSFLICQALGFIGFIISTFGCDGLSNTKHCDFRVFFNEYMNINKINRTARNRIKEKIIFLLKKMDEAGWVSDTEKVIVGINGN